MKLAVAQRRSDDDARIVGLKIFDTETRAEAAWTFDEIKVFLAAGGELFCPDQYGGAPTPVTIEAGPDGQDRLVSWTPACGSEPSRN